MFFCIALCSSALNYVLLYCIMLFCIELCASVLYYALLYWIMFFWIVLCFPVLNYGKVNYAYVISFMALSECHDLTPDNNLVTKKKGGYISCLSKPCLFCCQFVIFLDKPSNYNTFVDSYFVNMKFIFSLIRACV